MRKLVQFLKFKKGSYRALKANAQASIFLVPLFLVVIAFVVSPLVLSALEAFKVFAAGNRLDFTIGTDNFTNVWNDFAFQNALTNTTLIIFVATPIAIFLAFWLAWVISAIINKIVRNLILSLLYSQFFISSFAIGLAFIYLFGSQNQFFNLLGIDASFSNDKAFDIIWLYGIFHLWRVIPFNLVLFAFAFSKANYKYRITFKVDRLSWKEKLCYVYFYELKKSFYLTLYFNLLSALFLYPQFIIDVDITNPLIKAQTLMSYLLEIINPQSGELPNNAFASALSIIVFLYVITIIVSAWLFTKAFKTLLRVKLKYLSMRKGKAYAKAHI